MRGLASRREAAVRAGEVVWDGSPQRGGARHLLYVVDLSVVLASTRALNVDFGESEDSLLAAYCTLSLLE